MRTTNRERHCSEVCCSQLNTSHHFFTPLHGLENQQDQRLQRSTFGKASIISGYCLGRLLFFSKLFPVKGSPYRDDYRAHQPYPPASPQNDITQRGRCLNYIYGIRDQYFSKASGLDFAFIFLCLYHLPKEEQGGTQRRGQKFRINISSNHIFSHDTNDLPLSAQSHKLLNLAKNTLRAHRHILGQYCVLLVD